MEDEFSLEEMVLVFSYHVVNQILSSDGIRTPEEQAFLAATFPRARLVEPGFLAEDGSPTPKWSEALGEALLRLPEMAVDERLRIVRTSLSAARSDGKLALAEAEIVRRAARLLGLGQDQVDAILREGRA